MVIRRSHLASICLLALAVSISLTEYVMYSPSISSDDSVDDLFINDETHTSDSDVVDNDAEKPLEQDIYQDSQKSPEQQETSSSDAKNTTPAPIESSSNSEANSNAPFAKSNEHIAVISNGDTLASILTKLGFEKSECHMASKALSKVFNLKNLKIGQEIKIKASKNSEKKLALESIELKPNPRFNIVISKNSSGNFSASKVEVPIKKVIKSASGSMSPKSPASSLKQCGVNESIAREALRALNQVVDLKSSRSNIDFEFLYKDFYDESGKTVAKPELIYASILHNGKICKVYNFECNGSKELVDPNGVILKATQKANSRLIQPVKTAKITSKFGMRIHPISGKLCGHSGVDLSAPAGTIIRAAANGVVTKACYYAGYGKYVNIKHSPELSTAYGHLSKISVRPGQRIMQGQVIGLVGSSGYSTGNHLHYEVIKNNRPVNPLSFIQVRQEPPKLTGKKLVNFNQFKKEVNLQVVGLTNSSSSNKHIAAKVKKYS